jgi:hypothetical protein
VGKSHSVTSPGQRLGRCEPNQLARKYNSAESPMKNHGELLITQEYRCLTGRHHSRRD